MKNKKWITNFSIFLLGVILGYSATKLYILTTQNLILEKYLLELQICDYLTAKMEIEND